MTARDPLHTANPLPWEPSDGPNPPWHNNNYAYVLPRKRLITLLLVAVERLQEPCCDDEACPGWLAACEGWHNAFNDLTVDDQIAIDSAMDAGLYNYPPDPNAVA